MARLLTTDAVSANSRLEYWVDMICDVYVQLECVSEYKEGFYGNILTHAIPNLDISRVSAAQQRVLRSPKAISKSVDDCFLISVQVSGSCVVSQDDRFAHLEVGDFAIYDSTRPYALQFGGDFKQFVLKVNASQLRSMVKNIDQMTARKISGKEGAGYLLISLVNSLFDQIDSLPASSASSISQGIINILVGGLKSLPVCKEVSMSSLESYHIERIKHRIDLRLREPRLTIESIASELDMSIGHLHRLFNSQEQSASQYLWGRRLEACSIDLLDPSLSKATIAEIAFSWGFNDAAHFSRSFKSHFGCSPREWRTKSVSN